MAVTKERERGETAIGSADWTWERRRAWWVRDWGLGFRNVVYISMLLGLNFVGCWAGIAAIEEEEEEEVLIISEPPALRTPRKMRIDKLKEPLDCFFSCILH